MPTEIPLQASQTEYDFQQRTTLDGVGYILRFVWNQRESIWYMSIFDDDEVPIHQGIRFVANYPLNSIIRTGLGPPGLLIAVDLSEAASLYDPGLRDIGERVALLYYEESEVTVF